MSCFSQGNLVVLKELSSESLFINYINSFLFSYLLILTEWFVDLRAQYSMVRRIADGSFGLVYLMKSKVTQGLVAAKRLKHRKPEDVYFSRKEVHILSKISGGPGVVALIDYFESPAQSVIITEYLEGKELFLAHDVINLFLS